MTEEDVVAIQKENKLRMIELMDLQNLSADLSQEMQQYDLIM